MSFLFIKFEFIKKYIKIVSDYRFTALGRGVGWGAIAYWYVDHASDGSVIINFRILGGFPFFFFFFSCGRSVNNLT